MSASNGLDALHVLIVEDDEPDAELVEGLLASEMPGVVVTVASRLQDAVQRVREGHVDCVLLDLGLPDSQGMETIRALRVARGSTPIIVLTGRDDERVGVSALREGAQDYLVKGQVDGRSLRRAIRYAIERKALDEAKSQFIARAAHELRTPLAVLAGLGETVAANFERLPPDQMVELFAALDRQAKRARSLIGQLLDLSQAELGRVNIGAERLLLSDVVASVLDGLPPAEGVQISSPINESIEVLADRTRLEQILSNLVTNAYKYGGPSIAIVATSVPGAVVVSVTDDGPGMPDAVRSHLFEPFVRGSETVRAEGAGLGLAICRRLAQALDGRLELAETPSGTRFELTIPA